MGAERAPIPMILATGGVHTHLVRQSLRTFTSLNVRCAECLDVHYFAVLIGVGATTVNAYLAQESIADRQRRGLFGDMSLKEAVQRYKKAVDKGLLKVMSKMGISVISLLSRRLQFRGDRPVARAGRRVLPRHAVAHLRHRPARHRPQGARRCTTPPGTPRRSRCRSAASTSSASAARRTPSTAS